jgi:hypothetical protein
MYNMHNCVVYLVSAMHPCKAGASRSKIIMATDRKNYTYTNRCGTIRIQHASKILLRSKAIKVFLLVFPNFFNKVVDEYFSCKTAINFAHLIK